MGLTIFIGGSRSARGAAVRRFLGRAPHEDTSAPDWAFRRYTTPDASVDAIWLRDLHEAFRAQQVPGTRLVLTQSTYQLQRWLDWLAANPHATAVADADRAALLRSAPEASAGRGPWGRLSIVELEHDEGDERPPASGLSDVQAAFRQPDPEERYAASVRASREWPGNPALALACASACMELDRLETAFASLERAQELAPDWEAVHFEHGKLWLRADETERAAAAFAEAGRLMPSFSASFGNLGAALAELDRPDEAIAALDQARRFDPSGHTIVNNMGAVWRETGRLSEAEAAFRQVIELQPSFVFGYFNLAHTLLLQGRFAEACGAYEAGLTRDPQRNPRQACRLAIARAAAGDSSGAMADLERIAQRVPAGMMIELVKEVETTLTALSGLPGIDAAGMARVLERVEGYSS